MMFTWLAGESALMLATEAHSLGSCLPLDPVVSRPPARENPQPAPTPALSSVRWRVVGLGMVRLVLRYFPDGLWEKGNMER